DLVRDDREGEHERREKGDLYVDKEGFENVGVDEPTLPCTQQGLDQEGENRLREIETDTESRRQRADAPEQPAAELDQMFEQRSAVFVDILHGRSRRGSSGSASAGGSGAGEAIG